jgi:hypothetical protein
MDLNLPEFELMKPKQSVKAELEEVATVIGAIASIKTAGDAGINITVSIAATETDVVKRLLELKNANRALYLSFVAEK